jgi:hypothetical protein
MMFLNWEWPAMQGSLGFVREDAGEARPYRPPISRNQRFAIHEGMQVLPHAGISGSC